MWRGVGRILVLIAIVPACGVAPLCGEDQRHDWSAARQLAPGIQYQQFERADAEGKLVVHALRVDSRTPGISFTTTGRASNWKSNEAETTRETTRDFLRRNRAAGRDIRVAVNADAWTPWPAPFDANSPANLQGLAVSHDVLVSPSSDTPSLMISNQGGMRIETTSSSSDLSDIDCAVSGFAYCLRNGEVVESNDVVHPRTGLGLSQDNTILFLIAIDGRQPSSRGATVREVGQWLQFLGAHNGINMDGGGSTTLCWWDHDRPPEQACELLNRPVGNGKTLTDGDNSSVQWTERATGNNLGIYYDSTRRMPSGN